MPMPDRCCHSASIEVHCRPENAIDYLADGIRQGEWALGSVDRKQIEAGLYSGRSMFGTGVEYIRITPDREHGIIWYDSGRHPKALRRLTLVRVLAGPLLGRPHNACVITLLTWRPDGMTDIDWQRTAVAHETAVFIIKARLEESA